MAARSVRIHLPWTSVVFPALLAVCVMPLASAGGAWSVVYTAPALLLLLVVFAGTTATSRHLSARWLHGRVRLAWDEVQQLEFPAHRWAVAVTTSGRRVVLPGVRPADLPRIVAAAGGRLFLRRPVAARQRDDDAGGGTPARDLPVTGDAGTDDTPAEHRAAGPGGDGSSVTAAPEELGSVGHSVGR